MMSTYTLTFLLVGMLPQVRRNLPRGVRIQRPVCSLDRRWWV